MKSDLPPPPLNVQPQGLLHFLGIKNGGRNPETLDPTLQPMLDLTEHYLQTNAEPVFPATIALATGNNTLYNLDTPRDWWLYYNYVAVTWAGLNAADFIAASIVTYEPTSGRLRQWGPMTAQIANAGGTAFRAYSIVGEGLTYRQVFTAERIWVPPGWGLALLQHSGTSTGGLATINALLSRVTLR